MKDSEHIEEEFIYGYHPVLEAIKQNKPIQKIILQSGDFDEHTKAIWKDLKGTEYIVQRWPKFKLDRLAKGKTHQGIFAVMSPVAFSSLEEVLVQVNEQEKVAKFLWLDGVSDVRNLGAIIRSAACFDINGLIIPAKSGAMLNSEVVKSSAGGIYHVPLIQAKSVPNTLKILSEQSIEVVSITEKATEHVESAATDQPVCLVLGDESKGISREILDFSDHKFRINMGEKLGSLNVSVAAGIVLHQWFK